MSKKTRKPQTEPRKASEPSIETGECRVCGSSDAAVIRSDEQSYAGIDPEGGAYTHIVRTRVRCRACGQQRMVRSYRFRDSD